MKVEEIMKKYSVASTGNLEIVVTDHSGEIGIHTYHPKELADLSAHDDAVLKKTVGMILLKYGKLVIYAS